jgi:hypothetical protein
VGLQAVVAFERDFFERPAILHCLDCRTDSDALSSKASFTLATPNFAQGASRQIQFRLRSQNIVARNQRAIHNPCDLTFTPCPSDRPLSLSNMCLMRHHQVRNERGSKM